MNVQKKFDNHSGNHFKEPISTIEDDLQRHTYLKSIHGKAYVDIEHIQMHTIKDEQSSQLENTVKKKSCLTCSQKENMNITFI